MFFAYNAYIYIYIVIRISYHPARIEDEDPGYGSDAWEFEDARSGQFVPLRADRWYRTPPEEEIDGKDCSGIKCQIWERARVRSLMTHRLSGGGAHNLGYDAFPWEMIVHGNCGAYGRYSELAVLPDKVARYLFEFDCKSYASINLPSYPPNASSGYIHGLMSPQQAPCASYSFSAYSANERIYCFVWHILCFMHTSAYFLFNLYFKHVLHIQFIFMLKHIDVIKHVLCI